MPGRYAARVTTPYDDLPVEVRRANWGWFGQPWPSGICYGDDGRLLEEMRKSFPTGERCLYCDQVFDEVAGDSGQAMPLPLPLRPKAPQIRHVHMECLLRQVLGPVAHLEGRCTCYGGSDHDEPRMGLRGEALAVWAWVRVHGISPGV